jgi:hypothetical protein
MNKVATFGFVVLNDLHYLSPEDGPWLEALVREVNALPGVEFTLVLGDLAEEGKTEELVGAKRALDKLHMPYWTVPGNHDGPPGRPIGSGAGAAGLVEYERIFPGRRNYHFVHRGWQFVGLDTTNGSGYEHLPIPEETMAFARAEAGVLDKRLPTVLYTHMPLVPEIRFSSSQGYELLKILLPLNLRIVFCGHFHGNTEHMAPPPSRPGLKLVTNACCSRVRELHDGTLRRGYLRCRAKEDQSVEYEFVEFRGPGTGNQ